MYNQIIEKLIAAQHAARQAYQDAANFERDMLAGTGTDEPFFAVRRAFDVPARERTREVLPIFGR